MKELDRDDQQPPRRDRLIREHVHDPYKTRLKLADPTVCPRCGAVYHAGRWHWGERPAGAGEELCQACRRIEDDCPAGVVTIEGSFVAGHPGEIRHLIQHQNQLEKAEHPLHRVMTLEEKDGALIVTTTDIHLPRRIGEALYNAFRGDLDFHYAEEEYFLRVHWRRDV